VKIIDISQPLGVSTAVWPGDQPFELRWSMEQARGDSVNVAVLNMSVHTGTHTDGGYHVSASGLRAAQLPLDAFLGQALVIDARGREVLDERVLDDVALNGAVRVLFRTRDAIDVTVFPRDFLSPTSGLARRLVQAGVRLVGSDAPSMDHVDSKTLDAHHVLVDAGVAILENLVLSEVPAGVYTLIALPLKLTEADASPVRAVLLQGSLEES
jgi:arylformamidase